MKFPLSFLLLVCLCNGSSALNQTLDCQCGYLSEPTSNRQPWTVTIFGNLELSKKLLNQLDLQLSRQLLIGANESEISRTKRMMARVYEEARLCHGIVLNENTVVAPATCVNNVPVEAVGFERNSFESFTDNSIAITNVELHPQFDSSAIQNEHPLENNIALLRLVNPINFRESAEIQPACLAQLDSKRVHPQPVLLASGLGNNWPDRSYHNALELHSNGAGARSQQREYKRVGFTQSQILRAASIQSSSPLCTRDIGTPLHLLVNGNNGFQKSGVVGMYSFSIIDNKNIDQSRPTCSSLSFFVKLNMFESWFKHLKQPFCTL